MPEIPYICPRCRTVGVKTFGERTVGVELRWWTSTSCLACVSRSEGDGTGSLPLDLRAIEIAKAGSFHILVHTDDVPTVLMRLRKTLSIDLRETAALMHALPCPLFSGSTRAEAERLRVVLQGVADVTICEDKYG